MKILQNFFETILIKILDIAPSKFIKHCLFLIKQHPNLTDKLGYHIRPIHYYEPLPNFQKITSEQIKRKRNLSHINFNIESQLKNITQLGAKYKPELDVLAITKEPIKFDFQNNYFSSLDACLYYALIRNLKPNKIIEIGSGYSTQIAAKALTQNKMEGYSYDLSCIEPYPQPRLTDAKIEINLIEKCVEDVNLDLFTSLEANDILFIDSSHTVSFNNDVFYEFFEILPNIKSGVWIHIHDIFFPHDYPAEWLTEKRIAFNEQYFLEAFLIFNDCFSVKFANYWLQLKHQDIVLSLCPQEVIRQGYLGGSSFWMLRN
ncbi:class I SAM-dependent methyltransferase [Picosynechococcus sp. PCC 7003]|uniref:class I SAM-dependent methyltransferase n=1 Tax=Picosynechococcus sp. PCC 7003 TaxID=374981 RepID=UPI000ADB0F78|nr:class I SAM-dependent methyltransferase [Picosynechococcus sp. PCC 7003]